MKVNRVVLSIVVAVLLLSSCRSKNSSDKDDASSDDCIFGQVEACQCKNGIRSTRICLSEGRYTACECGENISCNDPGERFECDCSNGGTGFQICLRDGFRSKCNCPSSGSCCHELGTCFARDIVEDMVSESQLESFGPDSCGKHSDMLCIPDDLAAGNVPDFCESLLESEGRCLPDCLPEVADSPTPLPRSTCPKHHLCVPCYDSLNHTRTSACTSPGDAPIYPPEDFSECCGGNGYCLPIDSIESLMSEDEMSLLARDSCDPDRRDLCVPEVFIEDPDYSPASCQSIANGEGRCVPACLASIVNLPVTLPQDSCSDNLVCAPCYDPFSGELTDACKLPEDSGPVLPAITFDSCCEGLGHCVPGELIPEDQVSLLGEDSCEADEGTLCLPSIFTGENGYVPQECVSLQRGEGRCLPNCLPEVANAPVDFPQDVCPEQYVCAPCYDPVTTERTEACRILDDLPFRDPSPFDTCCNRGGTCIAGDLLTEGQRNCLDEDVCLPDRDLFCVPNEMIDMQNYIPEYCTSILDADGFCARTCTPDAQRLSFPQDVCEDGFVCLPYQNPTTGEENECGINFDEDKDWDNQIEWPKCCEDRGEPHGTCVPKDFLPEDMEQATISELPRDRCPLNKDYACVPDSLIEHPDTFRQCSAVIPIPLDDIIDLISVLGANAGNTGGGAGSGTTGIAGSMDDMNMEIPDSGFCLAKCLLSESEREGLTQDVCASHELCVPCSIGGTDIPGACTN